MAKINPKIAAYAKVMNISEEEAKKKFDEEQETEEQEENPLNDLSYATNDQQGSLGALEHSATLAKTNVINGTKQELKGITLNVSKEGEFSYNLYSNTLTITGKNCVIDIDEVTNSKLTIILQGSNIVLNSNVAVSKIRNYATNTVINGSDQNDNIDNRAEHVVINTGKGDDTIKNTKANVMIDGGEGNDNIANSSKNSYVFAGEGDDTIKNTGPETYIYGEAGNDNITNSGKNSYVFAGEGNDTIKNTGAETYIYGEAGNDNITNSGQYSNVYGNEGNDNITNSGNYSNVYGNEGDDTITNKASYSKVAGNQGKDNITNKGNHSEIYGNTESDTIKNTSASAILRDDNSEDVITTNKGFSFVNGLCYRNGQLFSGNVSLTDATDTKNKTVTTVTYKNGEITKARKQVTVNGKTTTYNLTDIKADPESGILVKYTATDTKTKAVTTFAKTGLVGDLMYQDGIILDEGSVDGIYYVEGKPLDGLKDGALYEGGTLFSGTKTSTNDNITTETEYKFGIIISTKTTTKQDNQIIKEEYCEYNNHKRLSSKTIKSFTNGEVTENIIQSDFVYEDNYSQIALSYKETGNDNIQRLFINENDTYKAAQGVLENTLYNNGVVDTTKQDFQGTLYNNGVIDTTKQDFQGTLYDNGVIDTTKQDFQGTLYDNGVIDTTKQDFQGTLYNNGTVDTTKQDFHGTLYNNGTIDTEKQVYNKTLWENGVKKQGLELYTDNNYYYNGPLADGLIENAYYQAGQKVDCYYDESNQTYSKFLQVSEDITVNINTPYEYAFGILTAENGKINTCDYPITVKNGDTVRVNKNSTITVISNSKETNYDAYGTKIEDKIIPTPSSPTYSGFQDNILFYKGEAVTGTVIVETPFYVSNMSGYSYTTSYYLLNDNNEKILIYEEKHEKKNIVSDSQKGLGSCTPHGATSYTYYMVDGEKAKGYTYANNTFYLDGELYSGNVELAGLHYTTGAISNGYDSKAKKYYVEGKIPEGYFTGTDNRIYKNGDKYTGYNEENETYYKDGDIANNQEVQVGDRIVYCVAGKLAKGDTYVNSSKTMYRNGEVLDGVSTIDDKRYIAGKIADHKTVGENYYEDGKLATGDDFDEATQTMYRNGEKLTGHTSNYDINGVTQTPEQAVWYKDGKLADKVEITNETGETRYYEDGKLATGDDFNETTQTMYRNGEKLTGHTSNYDINGITQENAQDTWYYDGKTADQVTIGENYYEDGQLATGDDFDETTQTMYREGEKLTGKSAVNSPDGTELYYDKGKLFTGCTEDNIIFKNGKEYNGPATQKTILQNKNHTSSSWNTVSYREYNDTAGYSVSDFRILTQIIITDENGEEKVFKETAQNITDDYIRLWNLGVRYSDYASSPVVESNISVKEGVELTGMDETTGKYYKNGSILTGYADDGSLYINGESYTGSIQKTVSYGNHISSLPPDNVIFNILATITYSIINKDGSPETIFTSKEIQVGGNWDDSKKLMLKSTTTVLDYQDGVFSSTGEFDGKLYYQGQELNGTYKVVRDENKQITSIEPDENSTMYQDGIVANNIEIEIDGTTYMYSNGFKADDIAIGDYYYEHGLKATGDDFDETTQTMYREGEKLTGSTTSYDINDETQTPEQAVWYKGGKLADEVEITDETGETHYYEGGKLATGDDYVEASETMYKDGEKLTGYSEQTGERLYYFNGKLLDGPCSEDESRYYKNGKRYTGFNDDNTFHYTDGKPTTGIVGEQYYSHGKLAEGYSEDKDSDMVFFNGEKYTGEYNKKTYSNGKKITGKYSITRNTSGQITEITANGENSKMYKDGEIANNTAVYGNYYVAGEIGGEGVCDGTYYKDGEVATGTYKDKNYYLGYPLDGIFTTKEDDKGNTTFIPSETGTMYQDGIAADNVVINSKLYVAGQVGGTAEIDDVYYINGEIAEGDFFVTGSDPDINTFYRNGYSYTGIYNNLYYQDGKAYNGTIGNIVFVNGIFAGYGTDGQNAGIDGTNASNAANSISNSDTTKGVGETDGVNAGIDGTNASNAANSISNSDTTKGVGETDGVNDVNNVTNTQETYSVDSSQAIVAKSIIDCTTSLLKDIYFKYDTGWTYGTDQKDGIYAPLSSTGADCYITTNYMFDAGNLLAECSNIMPIGYEITSYSDKHITCIKGNTTYDITLNENYQATKFVRTNNTTNYTETLNIIYDNDGNIVGVSKDIKDTVYGLSTNYSYIISNNLVQLATVTNDECVTIKDESNEYSESNKEHNSLVIDRDMNVLQYKYTSDTEKLINDILTCTHQDVVFDPDKGTNTVTTTKYDKYIDSGSNRKTTTEDIYSVGTSLLYCSEYIKKEQATPTLPDGMTSADSESIVCHYSLPQSVLLSHTWTLTDKWSENNYCGSIRDTVTEILQPDGTYITTNDYSSIYQIGNYTSTYIEKKWCNGYDRSTQHTESSYTGEETKVYDTEGYYDPSSNITTLTYADGNSYEHSGRVLDIYKSPLENVAVQQVQPVVPGGFSSTCITSISAPTEAMLKYNATPEELEAKEKLDEILSEILLICTDAFNSKTTMEQFFSECAISVPVLSMLFPSLELDSRMTYSDLSELCKNLTNAYSELNHVQYSNFTVYKQKFLELTGKIFDPEKITEAYNAISVYAELNKMYTNNILRINKAEKAIEELKNFNNKNNIPTCPTGRYIYQQDMASYNRYLSEQQKYINEFFELYEENSIPYVDKEEYDNIKKDYEKIKKYDYASQAIEYYYLLQKCTDYLEKSIEDFVAKTQVLRTSFIDSSGNNQPGLDKIIIIISDALGNLSGSNILDGIVLASSCSDIGGYYAEFVSSAVFDIASIALTGGLAGSLKATLSATSNVALNHVIDAALSELENLVNGKELYNSEQINDYFDNATANTIQELITKCKHLGTTGNILSYIIPVFVTTFLSIHHDSYKEKSVSAAGIFDKLWDNSIGKIESDTTGGIFKALMTKQGRAVFRGVLVSLTDLLLKGVKKIK